MDQQAAPSRQRLVIGIVVGLVVIGLLVVVLDWREVRKILGGTNWRLVPLALLFTAASYACLSFAFALVNRLFGIRMKRRDLAEIGFVSTILNHLLSTGGAAGYSVRFLLMGAQGATLKDILAASLFGSYFNSLGMLALLPVGLVYLFVKHPLSKGAATGVGVGAVLLVIVFFLATALVFVRSLRARLLRTLGSVAGAVVHRDIGPMMDEFDSTMARGVAAMREHPLSFILLIGLTVVDWTSSVAALWFCFDALGDPLKVGVLLTGFAIGVTVGVLSMVPGGLGVQEGSMAGIYALLGVPLQKAVLASILFRVVYYLIPYLVSLGFYWRLLRQVAQVKGKAEAVKE
jgi:uncharacterized protein (TIRG00374 family)